MDLDSLMNRFRLASRELFNYYFRVPTPYENSEYAWAQQERFKELEEMLFQKLVSEPAALPDVQYEHLQPKIALTQRFANVAPIMISREMVMLPVAGIGQTPKVHPVG